MGWKSNAFESVHQLNSLLGINNANFADYAARGDENAVGFFTLFYGAGHATCNNAAVLQEWLKNFS